LAWCSVKNKAEGQLYLYLHREDRYIALHKFSARKSLRTPRTGWKWFRNVSQWRA